MAFYDWNHSGENNIEDDSIEYKGTEDNNSNNHSSCSYCCGSVLGIVMIFSAIISVIGTIRV